MGFRGMVFLILTSVLGIRACAPRRELTIVNPQLPEWLEHLSIRNLRVGDSHVDLDFNRYHDRTFCNVVDIEEERLSANMTFEKEL